MPPNEVTDPRKLGKSLSKRMKLVVFIKPLKVYVIKI